MTPSWNQRFRMTRMGYRVEEVDEAIASLRQAESAGRPTPDLIDGRELRVIGP